MLTEIRADDPECWGSLPTNMGREVLTRIDNAFQGVFKSGRGLPRFKSAARWRSFGWNEMSGVTIEGDMVVFNAFGIRRHITFKRHRMWPDGTVPKTVRFVKKCNRWEVHVQIEFPLDTDIVRINAVMPTEVVLRDMSSDDVKAAKKERRCIAREINSVLVKEHVDRRKASFAKALGDGNVRGWDANVENHATSDLGQRIENPRLSDKHRAKRSKVEAKLARQQVGSNRWRQSLRRRQRLGERERNGNRTFAHQTSRHMVNQSPFLVFEELRLKNMTGSAKGTVEEPGTNVAQKAGLNREMLGNSHGTRLRYATYKAWRAGGLVIKVSPHGTSQTCSCCGARGAIDDKRRIFHCESCGLVMDRDRNAAINVLKRSAAVVGPCVERLPRCKARKDQREALAA